MGNDMLREYLLSAERTAELVGSVCTGSLILAAAGMLSGREATTHWSYATFLDRLGARYVKARWVRDGKFITSAGVSAGIDMALEMTSQLVGTEVARMIQIGLEYDPQPPLGRIDWNEVDMETRVPWIQSKMKSELAHRPELLRLLVDPSR
jgi:transcriptional regulator GlxA family with amidase domain